MGIFDKLFKKGDEGERDRRGQPAAPSAATPAGAALAELASASDPKRIGACLRSLKDIQDPAKVATLLALAADKRPTFNDTGNPIGQLAFWALASESDERIPLRAREVIGSLRSELRYTFPVDICVAAIACLERYQGPETRSFLLGLLPLDGNVAAAAAKALAAYPDPEVLAALEAIAVNPRLHCGLVDQAKASAAFIKRQAKKPATLDFAFKARTNAHAFSEGLVSYTTWDAAKEELLYGYLGPEGRTRIEPSFGNAGPFSEGLAWVKEGVQGGQYGFIDLSGKLVIAYGYSWAGDFAGGLAWVKKGDLYGFVDKEGRLAVDCRFSMANSFSDGLAAVEAGGKAGYVDAGGELRIPPAFAAAYDFSGGFAVVKNPEEPWNHGVIDLFGRLAVPFSFSAEAFSCFREGLLPVQKGDDCGFIDPSGAEVVAFGPDYRYGDFSEGLAPARERKSGRYGFIDKTGRLVIEARFEEVQGFSEGLAVVKHEGGYGYIDASGEFVVEPVLKRAFGFREGLAQVETDEGEGFIRKPKAQ